MPIVQRLIKACIVCLPLVALNIAMVVWAEFHPKEALAVAIYIHTPFVILSLPWSFVTVFIGPSLRDNFSPKSVEYLSDVIGLLAVLFNIFWLLNKYSFAKLLISLWSLAGIQGVLALFLVSAS